MQLFFSSNNILISLISFFSVIPVVWHQIKRVGSKMKPKELERVQRWTTQNKFDSEPVSWAVTSPQFRPLLRWRILLVSWVRTSPFPSNTGGLPSRGLPLGPGVSRVLTEFCVCPRAFWVNRVCKVLICVWTPVNPSRCGATAECRVYFLHSTELFPASSPSL